MVDNGEAKELRVSMVMRGASRLDPDRARQSLDRALNALARELGVDLVAVNVAALEGPGHSPGPGIYESEADWAAE